ncbi:MAG: hypothetical protein IT548_00800 [Alphaproteobacteria bacterium]|nr:hypothetical protein [Alphaproteobacteria bacterium]
MRISLAAVLAIVAAALFGGQPARALDIVAAEMQPLDLEIANANLVLAEIDRQAQARVQYLSAWITWWTSVKEMATETGTKMMKTLDERIEQIQKAAGLLSQLSVESPDQQRSLPGFGWNNTATLAQLAYTAQQEKEKWAKLIAEGKASWHIAAAGWVTGEMIQGQIDSLQQQIADINQGVRDGTWTTFIGGLGWVKGADYRGKIAAAEERKAAIRKLVTDGDYEVVIPGLGPRTRKRLEAEIAAAEEEVARRRAAAAAGDVQINHPLIGTYMTLNQLRDSLAEGEKAYTVMKATVNDGLYQFWVVELGWGRRIDLEGKVSALEATIANIQAAAEGGEYRADTPLGWVTRKEAEATLESISKQLANPALDQKGREYLAKMMEKAQKALGEIQAISAFDLLINAMEKNKWSAVITGLLKLARTDFEKRDLERSQKEKLIAEYPAEMAVSIKQAEAWLERLRAAREWIPG